MSLIRLDGRRELDRELVGGKAWAVNHLRRLGLPVPPAFTLGTDVCTEVLAGGGLPPAAVNAIREGIAGLESELDRKFGGGARPLLVSVRSGASRSMPGMMDTVLNVGATAAALDALTADVGPAFAADIAQRFAQQFGKVVGVAPPQDPYAQLRAAALAVFRSWRSPRAQAYRRHHGLSEDGGTAVTVQAMVLGNLDADSGTGVLFTRNPLSGDTSPLGEWLPQAQGEDVVSGRMTPLPLAALRESQPRAHSQLLAAAAVLERDATDVQDIEFTIESGTLWLLQTRAAKRSPEATVRIAVALQREHLIGAEEALRRVRAADVTAVLAPRIDPAAAADAKVLARGKPACPGLAHGILVGTADEAEERADDGEDVVLGTPTTDPDDVHGMMAARAVVTELGGSTSHAAVVSRELGRPCVVGCGTGTLAAHQGQLISVDGTSGLVYEGRVPLAEALADDDPDLLALARWAGVEFVADLPAALTRRAEQEKR